MSDFTSLTRQQIIDYHRFDTPELPMDKVIKSQIGGMMKSSDDCINLAKGWYDKDQGSEYMQYAFYNLALAVVLILKEALEIWKKDVK